MGNPVLVASRVVTLGATRDDDDDVCDVIFSLIFLHNTYNQRGLAIVVTTVANRNSGSLPSGIAGGSTIATGTVDEQTEL